MSHLARQLMLLCLLGMAPALRAETATPANGATMKNVLALVEHSHARLEREVRDYTFRLVRRERIEGKLRPHDFVNVKIRRATNSSGAQQVATPFSVYLRFTAPKSLRGREVLYVEGRNAGRMLIRRGGTRLAYVTTYLDPESPLAMEGNRHPVTDIGFDRLLGKIATELREDIDTPGVAVRFYENAKINDRACTRVAIIHPERQPELTYHRIELFFDKELELPAAFSTYGWPESPGKRPKLIEQYIYDNLKLNVGLTDADFDRSNPDYGFLRRDEP